MVMGALMVEKTQILMMTKCQILVINAPQHSLMLQTTLIQMAATTMKSFLH